MLVRSLIVLFAVLNLGVAAWWVMHDPAPPSRVADVLPGVARLQLVSETGGTAVARETPVAAETAQPGATVAPTPPRCFSFGPYASADAGGTAATRLAPLVRRVTNRVQPGAAARVWRVYLPPLPTPEQAQEMAQRIGAAGFDDFLVVRDGAEANSLALGRYGSEEAARKRADALNAAGFAARAEAIGGGDGAVWLDVEADAGFDPRSAQTAIAAAQYRATTCATAR